MGNGLDLTAASNASGDSQLNLDIIADTYFQDAIASTTQVRYIISEERPNLQSYGKGEYSVSLDPLDGSKSAAVGIPPGAIFGVFKDAQQISDFNGKHIVMGGFFVFSINLELYFSLHGTATKGVWDADTNRWKFSALPAMPTKKMLTSNFDFAGPLSEIVLLGNVALRSNYLKRSKRSNVFIGKKQLLYDNKNMIITNLDEANQFLTRDYRTGWELS